MKWLWAVPGVIAGLVTLMAIAGAMLPMKHVASRRARYRQPPEVLWAAIDGPQDWRPGFGHYELLPERDGHRVWREDIGRDRITFERVAADPPRRLETRIAQSGLPFGGTWIYEIEPSEGGCEVRVTERGEVYNVLFRFISRFILGHARSLEDSLFALGKRFGEKARIEE
jgi:hypothetical protein